MRDDVIAAAADADVAVDGEDARDRCVVESQEHNLLSSAQSLSRLRAVRLRHPIKFLSIAPSCVRHSFVKSEVAEFTFENGAFGLRSGVGRSSRFSAEVHLCLWMNPDAE